MASKSDIRRLEYTLGTIALFSAFVIYDSDPSGFGPFLLDAVAYLTCVVLLLFSAISFSPRRRLTYLVMVTGLTAAILISVYATTNGNGLPTQGNQFAPSCSTTTFQNGSATMTSTSCADTIPYFSYWTIPWNALFWLPIVGAIIYAMPSWIQPEKRNAITSGSRLLIGSVFSGTLLLLTFGLDNASFGYPELFNGNSPLNPFTAYSYCNSVMFGMVTCTQVNELYYSIDYAFWVVVVSLLAMVISDLTDVVKKRFAHENVHLPTGASVEGAGT